MTTEPKFIPDEGISLKLGDGTAIRVKLIDCVGYMIPEALGGEENGNTRMVRTPWHSEPVPFEEAAEYGTRKVIAEHIVSVHHFGYGLYSFFMLISFISYPLYSLLHIFQCLRSFVRIGIPTAFVNELFTKAK